MNRFGWMALAAGLLAGCDGDVPPTPDGNFGVAIDEGVQGCDNLDTTTCLYPFPSRAFVDDAGRLDLPAAGMMDKTNGEFLPDGFDRFAGFGAATPILFQLPGATPPTTGIFEPAPSLEADADVIVVDATTGERIPHWVEADFFSRDRGLSEPLFVIRPAIPLPRGTEVVVGVRNQAGLDGVVVDAPEGFRALRDGEGSPFFGVHDRREQFEDVVFPTLMGQGWERSEVQLAWSFPVRSSEEATSRLVAARDRVFAALPAAGPDYTLDRVLDCPGTPDDDEDCDPRIRTIVDGTIQVPSVMLPANEMGLRRMRVDDTGPVVEGFEAWPFRVQIPHSAYENDGPAPVLQYGHGFLGSAGEANNGWLRDLAQRRGLVILACDMQGMNERDALVWTAVLVRKGGDFPAIAELGLQGVINQLALQRLMKTSFADDTHPSLQRGDGEIVWDPETVWYHGNSQGGSVGTVMMAMSQDVTRGDLGVPGSGYPLLLHRSTAFAPFVGLLTSNYPEPDAIARFLALLGTGWDDFDPLTYAPHIVDPLPGTPTHQAIVHVAKEDQQVHNQASFILGRAAGGTLMTPAVRPVFGLPTEDYPASPAVPVVEVDFGIPDDPTPLDPPPKDTSLPNDGDTHGWLRQWEPAQDQMLHFFETGEMIDVCGGESCFHDGRP